VFPKQLAFSYLAMALLPWISSHAADRHTKPAVRIRVPDVQVESICA
jgi:hypothetical protein